MTNQNLSFWSSSGQSEAQLLEDGGGGGRGREIDGKMYHALIELVKLSVPFCPIHYSKGPASRSDFVIQLRIDPRTFLPEFLERTA